MFEVLYELRVQGVRLAGINQRGLSGVTHDKEWNNLDET